MVKFKKMFSPTQCCSKQVKDKMRLMFMFISENRNSVLDKLHLCWWYPKNICSHTDITIHNFLSKELLVSKNSWIWNENKYLDDTTKLLLNKGRFTEDSSKTVGKSGKRRPLPRHTEIRWLNRETGLHRELELETN